MNRTVRETLAFAGEKVSDHREKRAAARESRRRSAQRRREWQQVLLARRIHPATGAALHEDATLKCGGCVHVLRVGGVAGRYYKCELSRVSRSETTDIRLRWPACTQFEPRPA